jgi:dipeptidyl aminopeptidase/acylaminoacyl peptidase
MTMLQLLYSRAGAETTEQSASTQRLGRLAVLAGSVALLMATASQAQPQTSAAGKPALTFDRLLPAVISKGKLAPTQSFNAAIAWAGPNHLVFASPRGGRPPEVFAATLDGKVRTIAQGSSPMVSADGRRIVYVRPDGQLVVGLLGETGVEGARVLKRHPDGARNPVDFGCSFAWQTGGRLLAYLSYQSAEKGAGAHDAATLGDPEIRVFDPQTGADRSVYVLKAPTTEKVADATVGLSSIAMTPDGEVLFSEEEGRSATGSKAFLKGVKDGRVRTIARTGNRATLYPTNVSPDGRWVDMLVSEDPDFWSFSATDYRATIDLQGGAVRIIRGPYSSGRGAAWTADSRQALYICKTGALLDQVCAAGASISDDRLVTELDPLTNLQGLALSPDGKTLAWMSRDTTDTLRLRFAKFDPSGAVSDPRTLWADALIPEGTYALGETRKVHWKNGDVEFEGLLTLPPGYVGGRLPLFVDIHGGSNGGVYLEGQMLNASPLEKQVWAGMGYAYFSADYRAGYVAARSLEAFQSGVGKDYFEDDARDVLAGIDAVVASGVADPKRIVGLGHSAGSWNIAELVTLTGRLSAAVAKEGSEDQTILPGLRDPAAYPSDMNTRMYLYRADNLEDLRAAAVASSPIFKADRIKTPVLVIKSTPSAERIEAGKRFVDAVNKAGGQASLISFPGDVHVVTQEANIRLMTDAVVRFLNEHAGVTSPPK